MRDMYDTERISARIAHYANMRARYNERRQAANGVQANRAPRIVARAIPCKTRVVAKVRRLDARDALAASIAHYANARMR